MTDQSNSNPQEQNNSLGASGTEINGIQLSIPDDVLKPFQLTAVDRATGSRKFIFCHETGLGKTVMSIATLERVFAKANVAYPNARILALGGTSAVDTWLRLGQKWMGIKPTYISGTKIARERIWANLEKGEPGFWTATYDTYWRDALGNDRRNKFDVVIADEIHKARNRKTKRWEGLKHTHKAPVKIGASATLASRGPQDLWGILNWLNPQQFPSYWAFINRWCFVIEGAFGKEITGVKDPEGLRKLLTNFMITDTWANVAPQMPPVTREIITLEMSKKQAADYHFLEREMMLMADGDLILAQNSLAKLTYMRQMSICPTMLLPNLEYGSMIEYLVERIEDDPYTVVFSPYREFGNVLRSVIPNVFILKQEMNPDERRELIDAWRAARGVICLTIALAESFDLSGPRTAYFAGFEWDPNLNIQAEGRLRRMDSEEFNGCLVQYLVSRDSVDYHVKDVVEGKISNVRQFMRPEQIFALIKSAHATEKGQSNSS